MADISSTYPTPDLMRTVVPGTTGGGAGGGNPIFDALLKLLTKRNLTAGTQAKAIEGPAFGNNTSGMAIMEAAQREHAFNTPATKLIHGPNIIPGEGLDVQRLTAAQRQAFLPGNSNLLIR